MSIDFNWFNGYFRTKAPRGWVSRWVLSRLCCEKIRQLSCDSCGSSQEGEPSRDTEYFLHDNTITSRQRPPEEYWSKAARHTTGRALKSFSNIEWTFGDEMVLLALIWLCMILGTQTHIDLFPCTLKSKPNWYACITYFVTILQNILVTSSAAHLARSTNNIQSKHMSVFTTLSGEATPESRVVIRLNNTYCMSACT